MPRKCFDDALPLRLLVNFWYILAGLAGFSYSGMRYNEVMKQAQSTVNRNAFLISYKLFFALLGFSSIVAEMVVLMERGVFKAENFFSYFTIETNILVVATLLLSAVAIAAGKESKFDLLRSATTVYILVVGIGFSALLSHLEDAKLTAVPWDNVVLHYIIPVAMLVDFLTDRPRKKLAFSKALLWLLFPIMYATYALVRGGMTGWYPYPFLNPDISGAGSVVATVIGLLVLGFVLVWSVGKLSTGGAKGR